MTPRHRLLYILASLQIAIFLLGTVFVATPQQVSGETSKILAKGNLMGDFYDIEFPEGGGRDSSLSIVVPNSGPVLSASLLLSNVPGSPGPSEVMIDIGLDQRAEWSFGGEEEGRFGLQDSFIDGEQTARDRLETSGKTYSFFLPHEAELSSTKLTVSSPPTPEINQRDDIFDLDQHFLPLEATDVGDMDGDGDLELVYYDKDDDKIYAINTDQNGTTEKITISSSIEDVTNLRIIPGPSESSPALILSRISDSGSVVDMLIGDDIENMERMSISKGLPKGSPGFFYNMNTGSVLTLNDSIGTVYKLEFDNEGDLSLDMRINDTINASSITEADLDGDGDMDLLIFPPVGSRGNITVCESLDESLEGYYNIQDTGLSFGSKGIGVALDIDGDGNDEVYSPIGDQDHLSAIYLDGSGELRMNWIGMNHTYGVPRTIPRDLYGNGSLYRGSESFLYVSTYDGLYHGLSKFGPGSEHIWRKSISFPSLAILGETNTGIRALSIDRDLSLISSTLRWGGGREVSISTTGGSNKMEMDIDPRLGSIVDISQVMGEIVDPPRKISDSGNILLRYDIEVEGRDGFLSLSNLEIEYDITMDVSNSEEFLSSVIEKLEETSEELGQDRIFFTIFGSSEGVVRVGPVDLVYDSPPVIEPPLPGSLTVLEGSSGESIMNIRDHLIDDNLLSQGLDAELVLDENLPSDLLFLDRNGNLVAQAFKYPDLNGEFRFAFRISDLRNTVQTDPIVLIIEPTGDKPVLVTGLDDTSIEEGITTTIKLNGENGLFMDPDGDELSFSWSISNPDPISLVDHLSIGLDEDSLTLLPSINGQGGSFRLEIEAYDDMRTRSDGTLAVVKVDIIDVDANPRLGLNPGTIHLIEDQDTPSRIPLAGWFIDPDTRLSAYNFNVYSPTPYLETSIKEVGGEPYLFLHPRGDLNGEVSLMLEMTGDGTNIMDRLRVKIEPINDKPELLVDGKDLLENRGWMVNGRVRDHDTTIGVVEYRIGDGDWISAWGFESWSLIIDFKDLPMGGGFIFIRAYDHEEYSVVTYVKLSVPEPDLPIIIGDDDDDDDDDEEPPIDYKPPNDAITPIPSDNDEPPWAIYGGIIGIIVAAIIFFGFTEVGMIIMATVGASIYSKLSKKDILNHEIRGLIRGYIIANPGDHYSSIKRNLDLNNGTLAYHLRVLETSGFIKSMYDGIYKRYYPSNVNISKLKKNVSKQEEIFNIILEHPGVTMEEIGRMIGVSRQVVNYHVKNLIRGGVVSYQRDRKSARFFPSEEGMAVFEQT